MPTDRFGCCCPDQVVSFEYLVSDSEPLILRVFDACREVGVASLPGGWRVAGLASTSSLPPAMRCMCVVVSFLLAAFAFSTHSIIITAPEAAQRFACCCCHPPLIVANGTSSTRGRGRRIIAVSIAAIFLSVVCCRCPASVRWSKWSWRMPRSMQRRCHSTSYGYAGSRHHDTPFGSSCR